jgi:hypothetical protein
MTRRRFDWTSTRWMSTRQKPLLALWVYFDRQRFALGLPRIAQGLDRLDSSSLSVSTWPPTRPRDLVPDCNRHRRADARLWRTGRPDDVGGASVGGLMASLDSYHLDLVLAVLGHAGSGGSARNSSNDSAGQ